MNQIIEQISDLAGRVNGIFSAKEDEGNWELANYVDVENVIGMLTLLENY